MSFFGYDLSETQDLLNVVLAIGFLGIAIALVMVLIRVYKLLGNVNTITEKTTEVVELVNHYLWQPARIGSQIMEKVRKLMKK